MDYFVYCKKSSEDKNRQIISLDDQEKIYREVATHKGFTIRGVYRENKSAKWPNPRLDLQVMLARISQGEDTNLNEPNRILFEVLAQELDAEIKNQNLLNQSGGSEQL